MKNNPFSTIASRRIPIALVIGLTLLSGVVHGYLDGRWSVPANLIEQGAELKKLPKSCGDWELVESLELEPGPAKLLRCYGSDVRIYRNKKTDALVNVAVLFGPRGPIAVHTPEVCYSSVGTRQTRDKRAESISTAAGRHQLWSVDFAQQPDPNPSLEVLWGWSDGGNWHASKYPRIWMTENLYKIQVAGPIGDGALQPCRDFLQSFLPYVEKVIR